MGADGRWWERMRQCDCPECAARRDAWWARVEELTAVLGVALHAAGRQAYKAEVKMLTPRVGPWSTEIDVVLVGGGEWCETVLGQPSDEWIEHWVTRRDRQDRGDAEAMLHA